MQSRWSQDRREGWLAEIDAVLDHVADNGATCSLDVSSDEKKGSGGWWDWHPPKTALEFLWRCGRLSVCHRRGFRKYYDLTENVIPADHLNSRMDDDEIIEQTMSAALERLGFASSGELAAFFGIVTKDEAKVWCARALASGQIVEVDVETAEGSRRRCFTTEALLVSAADLPEPTSRVRILSPFDPVLRDRARAERLFGFNYRIEIFVPKAKRRYGYYVFPVLQGDRVIGRIDAKRTGPVLVVRAFWPEAGVRMGKARITGLKSELDRVRHPAGVETVEFSPDWLQS